MFQTKKLQTAQEVFSLLNCRRLPARLTTGETAAILGFSEHDIAPLIAARLIEPLGKPAPNAPKYFASVEVEVLAADREWLAKATRAVSKYWQLKNARKATDSSLSK